MWGAVGHGVASLIGGFAYDSAGGNYVGVMIAFVAASAGTLAASTMISIGRTSEVSGGQAQDRTRYCFRL